ncbi:MAG: response regulator transcription factor [candidate division KSB1 bacterium]|nr:response regulator transcription factor [candidate division KSB1 bacterium]
MGQRKRILIVDDDPKLIDLLRLALEREGFAVVSATNGLQGERVFRANPVDLVILDVMMPQRDGFELLGDLRAISNVPIIMLTARSETDDVVKGLELGADDYIHKPFNLKEVIARVNAALARVERLKASAPATRVLSVGDVSLDLDQGVAIIRHKQVPLTPIELELLRYMMMHAGRLLERETLLRDVWGYDYFGKTNLVDVAIRRLREKIEPDPSQPTYLLTVRGQGYRFASVSAGSAG